MSVIISSSISIDGFICGPNGEEDWISGADEKYFASECEKADYIIIGSTTYDSNPGYFPFPGGKNIVFTKNAKTREAVEGITFNDGDMIAFISEHKDKNILIAGGGHINGSVLTAKLATDITICVHPIVLGSGTRQFEGVDFQNQTTLEKVSERDIGEGVVLIHYKIS